MTLCVCEPILLICENYAWSYQLLHALFPVTGMPLPVSTELYRCLHDILSQYFLQEQLLTFSFVPVAFLQSSSQELEHDNGHHLGLDEHLHFRDYHHDYCGDGVSI